MYVLFDFFITLTYTQMVDIPKAMKSNEQSPWYKAGKHNNLIGG